MDPGPLVAYHDYIYLEKLLPLSRIRKLQWKFYSSMATSRPSSFFTVWRDPPYAVTVEVAAVKEGS